MITSSKCLPRNNAGSFLPHRVTLAVYPIPFATEPFREAAPKHTADEEESLFPRLRQIESADMGALMARIESLEGEHVCAGRSHGEVDSLGRLWLRDGMLPADQAAYLLTLLLQLRDLYRHHIATEGKEVFPAAAVALSASDRQKIGSEMAHRRLGPRER